MVRLGCCCGNVVCVCVSLFLYNKMMQRFYVCLSIEYEIDEIFSEFLNMYKNK